jgi:hypothetical protein
MAKEADPAAVVETIRASIEASRRGSRRVRAHRFRELFGYQAWSAQRREHVEKLLKEAGIVVQPGLDEAGRDDWLVMSTPTLPEVCEEHREPRGPGRRGGEGLKEAARPGPAGCPRTGRAAPGRGPARSCVGPRLYGCRMTGPQVGSLGYRCAVVC